jgi:glycosyltransferase involved in cell wall biosynthesis
LVHPWRKCYTAKPIPHSLVTVCGGDGHRLWDLRRRALAEVEIGILTRGKPTLGMTLSSLLLQEVRDIRVFIVDTAEKPVINRDDIAFALRLAIDRGIPCNYEYLREKNRAFSTGRLRILEALKGRHLCFMDDDIVIPSASLGRLLEAANSSREYGFIAPSCQHSVFPHDYRSETPLYATGALIWQDQVVREILMEYYRTSVDVLDKARSRDKVWEPAFLTRLFPALDRSCVVQEDNPVYHLDYREPMNWDALQEQIVGRSAMKAEELASRRPGADSVLRLT